MLRGNRKYILLLLVCFGLLIFIQYKTPKPIDWRPTFSKKDNIPFGTLALFEIIQDLFGKGSVKSMNKPAYNVLTDDVLPDDSYLFISYYFNPDELDTRHLLKYAELGRNIFIASNTFQGKFADTLKLHTSGWYFGWGYYIPPDKNDTAQNNFLKKNPLRVNFVNPFLRSDEYYVYERGVEDIYFTSFDSSKTSVIGENSSHEPNLIKIKYGSGNIFLSTLPQLFGNYCFTDEKNCEYVYKSLSLLRVQKGVMWDEYYKYGNVRSDSPLKFVFNTPPLLWAYYTLLITLILYLLFGGKRKQRVIPVVKPLTNTTLEFVDIVGTLYFHQGDHKNISDKKISYFLENIRVKFGVKTNVFDDTFITKISSVSGIDTENVRKLFYNIAVMQAKAVIMQEDLIKMNSLMEDFYKQSKR
jgi:hypothetical protein